MHEKLVLVSNLAVVNAFAADESLQRLLVSSSSGISSPFLNCPYFADGFVEPEQLRRRR